jgi:hypothetical protein
MPVNRSSGKIATSHGMADQVLRKLEPVNPNVRSRVENALKLTIESEPKRAVSGDVAGYFSRGAIVSRSNGLSRGIFFSRNAAVMRERPDEVRPISELILDEAVFDAFAERLSSLRQAAPWARARRERQDRAARRGPWGIRQSPVRTPSRAWARGEPERRDDVRLAPRTVSPPPVG